MAKLVKVRNLMNLSPSCVLTIGDTAHNKNLIFRKRSTRWANSFQGLRWKTTGWDIPSPTPARSFSFIKHHQKKNQTKTYVKQYLLNHPLLSPSTDDQESATIKFVPVDESSRTKRKLETSPTSPSSPLPSPSSSSSLSSSATFSSTSFGLNGLRNKLPSSRNQNINEI